MWNNILSLENLIYKKCEEHYNIVESLINEETTSEAWRSLSVSAVPMPDPSSQLKMCINVMTSSWSRVRHWSAPERLQWTEAEASSQSSSSLATGKNSFTKIYYSQIPVNISICVELWYRRAAHCFPRSVVSGVWLKCVFMLKTICTRGFNWEVVSMY